MSTDITLVYNAIKGKQSGYNSLDGYYRGNQPTVYLTQRLREIFRDLDLVFTQNWCAVTIDACNERISLTGFDTSNEAAKAAMAGIWSRNQLGIEASDIHTDAQVLGECYAIVWPGEDGKAEVFYNDPRLVHMFYSSENPRKKRMAGKMWCGDDGKAKMTLYYADRVEYYTSTGTFENTSSGESFVLDESVVAGGTAVNKFGKVPVFHFRVGRNGRSDLMNVLPLQNGANKLLSDMLVAAEFGAYSQRWVISNSDISALENTPGKIWGIPAGDGSGQDSQVGQFAPTDLGNYLDAVDRIAQSIGVISRTPRHYFYGQGGVPSGEALIAMEAPLNKKATDRIDRFAPIWRELAVFACLVEGVTLAEDEVTAHFEKPETVQPKTGAEIIKISVDSGIPLETAVIKAGWSASEVSDMLKIKEKDNRKSQAGLAAALQSMKEQTLSTPEDSPMNNQGQVPNKPAMPETLQGDVASA